MNDIVDPETRSRLMAGIRCKNTKPELIVRKYLHKFGFRFRLHNKNLPGCPDIILKKHRAIILVHGCFWHQHECHLFKWPVTRASFWRSKIEHNKKNDKKFIQQLLYSDWRVCVIWECALKGTRKNVPGTMGLVINWLHSSRRYVEILG